MLLTVESIKAHKMYDGNGKFRTKKKKQKLQRDEQEKNTFD